jgi:hypothetical protein
MPPKRPKDAVVGVADHAGWAVLITVHRSLLVDRRRVELVADDLPKLPHHHEAQALPLEQGVALIERVRGSAEAHARASLEALASSLPMAIEGVALRECPDLPPTIAARLADYRAQNVADTVMYRAALADAAAARGWWVRWYDPRQVFEEAARALGLAAIEDLLEETRARLGTPWQKDHRVAMAAALAARRPA